MSLYDDAVLTVTEKLGPQPTRPGRVDFTQHYGYAKGENLGLFPTIADATAAGAVTTEKTVDEDALRAATDAYRDWNTAVSAEYQLLLRAEHSELPAAVFDIVYGQAYEDAHSYGFAEVEGRMDTLAGMALKIIAAGDK